MDLALRVSTSSSLSLKPEELVSFRQSCRPSCIGTGIKNCRMMRRGFVSEGVKVASASVSTGVVEEAVEHSRIQNSILLGAEILPFRPEGYNYWTWRGHKIHYVVEGEGDPIVLIHGFGASAFHWRYNIPVLSKTHKVYALDLLGFGWSDKALIEYDATIWSDQVGDFLKEIVKQPAVVVGNSLGGFTALLTTTQVPEQVRAVVLLNSAGQFQKPKQKFKDEQEEEEEEESTIDKFLIKPLKETIQRIVLRIVFWQSKQPSRIRSVLKSVYPNSANVDDYLVESIIRPAEDPNAGEVYYRLMTRFLMNQTTYTLDAVLSKLSCPILLLWGELDPWVDRTKASKIMEFYPNSTLVSLPAGHCPHDEVPGLVNEALVNWLASSKL